MKKSEIKNEIMELIKEGTTARIDRVFGVSNGVGYDLTPFIETKNGVKISLDVHALRTGWAYPKHLRPNNPDYKYTGSNDIYQDKVIGLWNYKNGGFSQYLDELKKAELLDFLKEIKSV